MVKTILKDDGFANIVTAASMGSGIELCKTEHPDLAILDIMLPDGDGYQLMEKLRDFTDIPVIFLTAKDAGTDKLAGLGLGADDYIVKPFMPQELILRVCAILRRCYREDAPLVHLFGLYH